MSKNLAQTDLECKYYIVWIPMCCGEVSGFSLLVVGWWQGGVASLGFLVVGFWLLVGGKEDVNRD